MELRDISTRAKEWRAPGLTVLAIAAILLAELGVAYLVLGGFHAPSGGLMVRDGYPVGGDFVLYYSVSKLALGGDAAAVYDVSALHALEQQVVGAEVGSWPWFYPPTFLLAALPLSLMPYPAALAVWLLPPLGAFLLVAYRIAPRPATPVLALLFPAVAGALFSGQNGCLTAALIGGGLLLLERRPLLSGVLLGLLSYKPQLVVLIAVALLAGRHWRALAAAAACASGLAAASVAAFGLEPWIAFIDDLPVARRLFEEGLSRWPNMPTVFAAARLLRAEVWTAWVLQGMATLAAAAAVAWLWRRPVPLGLRASGLILALPLATPYAQFYDLVMLALPIAWLAWEARAGGWMRGEALALVVLWVAPLATRMLAKGIAVQPWPLILAALLMLVLRRARRDGAVRLGERPPGAPAPTPPRAR